MTDGSSYTPPPPPPQQAPPPPPNSPGVDPTYAPGGAPKKKGLPPLAWVGIGCGVIVLIGLAVLLAGGFFFVSKVQEFNENPEMNAAKLIVAANPELEMVESDDEAGTLTVRNTKTGEVYTADVSDLRNGRLTFSDGDGEEIRVGMGEDEEGRSAISVRDSEGNETFRLGAGGEGDIPAWVPRYPGVEIEGTAMSRRGGQVNGGFTFETDESVEDVAAWYAEELEDLGLAETGRSDNRAGNTRLLNLTFEGDGRTVTSMVTSDGGRTRTVVSYSEKGE